MNSVFEDTYLNCKSLITTDVATLMGNRLFDEPELIVIKVVVSFVVSEQVLLTPATKHETALLKDDALMRFSHV